MEKSQRGKRNMMWIICVIDLLKEKNVNGWIFLFLYSFEERKIYKKDRDEQKNKMEKKK